MSYRDDHDAALARLVVLEAENCRLTAANAQLRRRLAHREAPGPPPIARPGTRVTRPLDVEPWTDRPRFRPRPTESVETYAGTAFTMFMLFVLLLRACM